MIYSVYKPHKYALSNTLTCTCDVNISSWHPRAGDSRAPWKTWLTMESGQSSGLWNSLPPSHSSKGPGVLCDLIKTPQLSWGSNWIWTHVCSLSLFFNPGCPSDHLGTFAEITSLTLHSQLVWGGAKAWVFFFISLVILTWSRLGTTGPVLFVSRFYISENQNYISRFILILSQPLLWKRLTNVFEYSENEAEI